MLVASPDALAIIPLNPMWLTLFYEHTVAKISKHVLSSYWATLAPKSTLSQ